MKGLLLIIVFLFVAGFQSKAQYANTCELVIIPGQQKPITLTQYLHRQERERNENVSYLAQFLVPGNGGKIISNFGPRSGRMHFGTDIKKEKGDTVYAVQDGLITSSEWGSGFGNLIVIQHENNIETYYAHLSKYLKHQGDWINKGEPIGIAGSTGRARGIHLHFEIHEGGKAFDSEMVFDYDQRKVRDEARNFESLVAMHSTLKPQGYANNMATPEFYKVRTGDSLWAISRKFKTPIKEICQLNNLTENSVLQVGQPIKMY